MRLYTLESGWRSGAYNMALDEALLETVRAEAQPVLIVRTYGWAQPTLSLGVHQRVRDIHFLLNFYRLAPQPQAIVRRPTGGRAILHGEDLSFSFVTNDPAVLKQSLKAAYSQFSAWVQETLGRLSIRTHTGSETQDNAYLRSAVCFETLTHSDLLGENGQKLCGSAQLRRAGGMLQHGAAFLAPYGISGAAFSQALFETVAAAQHQSAEAYPLSSSLEALRNTLEAGYAREAETILASASVTSGSHLLPASP